MRALVIAATLAAGLSACATVPPPSPPILDYARNDCDVGPVLANAISLTPEKETNGYMVSTPVNAATPCLRSADPAGRSSPYLVYLLPEDRGDKTLTVGAVLEGARILSPAISLLNDQGQITRTFAPLDYLYRGAVFSVQFRPRDIDAYVLVTADPSRIGQRYDAIAVGTNTTVISTGYLTSNYTTGVEASTSRTFSYEGTVHITVYDSDTDEEAAPPTR